MESHEMQHRAQGLRRGMMVLIALAVLTGIEYFVATLEWPVFILILIALLKAAAVLYYFMHLPKVFRSEGDH